jgi:glycosyltransferase involved in cell wall biosynthesis
MLTYHKMTRPLVSVIAVSYNHEKWVTDCLESISNQTLKDFELIYADDGSKDATVCRAVKWLDRYHPNAKRIIHSTNRGLCATLNEAFSCAEGAFVQLLACDDRLEMDKLEKQVHYLSQAPGDLGFVFGNFGVIDCEGQVLKDISYSPRARPPQDMLSQVLDPKPGRPSICMLTVLFRKVILDRVFPLDETLSFEGIQIWTKLLSQGTRGAYFPERLAWYRLVPNSLSRDTVLRRQVWEDLVRFIEGNLSDGLLSAWSGALRRRLQKTLYMLLRDAAMQRDEERFRTWLEKYKAHFGGTLKSLYTLLMNLDGDRDMVRWVLRCSPLAADLNRWVYPLLRMRLDFMRMLRWTTRKLTGCLRRCCG